MKVDRLCQEIESLLNADFFDTFYGKRHIAMKLKSKEGQDLFNDAQIEAIIRFNEMKERSPKVFFHGHRVSLSTDSGHAREQYDHIMRLHSGGASLICNQTQKVSNNIAYLTDFLARKFECRVHGNLYITPPKMTAFRPHYDKHDVIVIQLKGSKKWSFYELPIPQQGRNIYEKSELKKTDELSLKAGDLLYVPHGLIHSAESTSESSWHITLGLTGYYWKDALKDLIEQAATPQNLSLFKRLPVKSGQQNQLEGEAIALLEMIKTQVDLSAGLTKFKEESPNIDSHGLPIPEYGFTKPEDINENQLFSFIDSSQLKVETSKERLVISMSAKAQKLHLKTSLLGLVNRMRSAEEFTSMSLKGNESDRDIRLFLSFMMENGFIKTVGK